MSVSTNFVVAARSDAELVGEAEHPDQAFHGLDAKGIAQVHLGALHAILSRQETDPDFMTAEETFLYSASDDGPWVLEVPEELIRMTAGLDGELLVRVARKWGETEEFEGWPLAEVEGFLHDFATLCRRALEEEKTVLLWMRLSM